MVSSFTIGFLLIAFFQKKGIESEGAYILLVSLCGNETENIIAVASGASFSFLLYERNCLAASSVYDICSVRDILLPCLHL